MPAGEEEHGCCYLFWNLHRISGAAALLALLAGRAALCGGADEAGAHEPCACDGGSGGSGHSRGRERAAEAALDALRKIFGAASVPEPLAVHVTAWETDPFSLGSYSHIATGASPADYDALAQPHGRVHFAGEATCSTHPATASGAYLSGLRAAAEVLCAATPRPAGADGDSSGEGEEESGAGGHISLEPPLEGEGSAKLEAHEPGRAAAARARECRSAGLRAEAAPPDARYATRRRGARRLPAAMACSTSSDGPAAALAQRGVRVADGSSGELVVG